MFSLLMPLLVMIPSPTHAAETAAQISGPNHGIYCQYVVEGIAIQSVTKGLDKAQIESAISEFTENPRVPLLHPDLRIAYDNRIKILRNNSKNRGSIAIIDGDQLETFLALGKHVAKRKTYEFHSATQAQMHLSAKNLEEFKKNLGWGERISAVVCLTGFGLSFIDHPLFDFYITREWGLTSFYVGLLLLYGKTIRSNFELSRAYPVQATEESPLSKWLSGFIESPQLVSTEPSIQEGDIVAFRLDGPNMENPKDGAKFLFMSY